jgi:hypothetical protein
MPSVVFGKGWCPLCIIWHFLLSVVQFIICISRRWEYDWSKDSLDLLGGIAYHGWVGGKVGMSLLLGYGDKALPVSDVIP